MYSRIRVGDCLFRIVIFEQQRLNGRFKIAKLLFFSFLGRIFFVIIIYVIT